mgnify:CR=1 FL=1
MLFRSQALPKGQFMDAIVRKATEIGAVRIVPLQSERTQVHLEGDRSDKKLEKWQTAALEAAKQCGNPFLPEIDLASQGTRQRFSTTQATPVFAGVPVIRNNVRLALTTSFELDFWGRLRRGVEAAQALALGTRYARDVVSVTVAGLTTQAYFSLRSLDAQVALTRSTQQLVVVHSAELPKELRN